MSVRRYTGYNIAGAVLPFAVSLLTVPAYLHLVGGERFGVLSVVWLLLGYFGLFDLGLGMATSQQIAARATEGPGAQARIFWTALVMNAGLGVVGGLLAWPAAAYYFGHVMKVAPLLRLEMLASIPWLVLAVPTATINGVATGALQGLNRFGPLNVISVIGTVLFQTLPLAAAYWWSPSLTIVLPVTLVARAATLALLAAENRRALLRGHPISFARSEARKLLRFGVWVTASSFFTPLLAMVDRFVIGAFAGAAAVTAYVVPFNLGDRMTILGNSLGSALFPRFSALSRDEAGQLAYQSERVLIAIMVVVIVTAMFLLHPFLSLWVGSDLANTASPIGEVLFVGFWLDSVSRVPLYGLRGQSRPEVIAQIDLIQLVPFWIVLYFLIKYVGLIGVAYAYLFRVTLNYLLLAGWFGTLRRLWPYVLVGGLLLVAAATLAGRARFGTVLWPILFSGMEIVALLYAWRTLPLSGRNEVIARLRQGRAAIGLGGRQ